MWGGIENSITSITIWHHEASRVMTNSDSKGRMMRNGDPEGRAFLSHPHTDNGFLFLLNVEFPEGVLAG